jgi:predicted metallo-beta-lactamase superfamily hydrolase|tara:strand:- start:1987 stop:2223 length:237 start_codon:yes stop_codon:yes gene_type:complete
MLGGWGDYLIKSLQNPEKWRTMEEQIKEILKKSSELLTASELDELEKNLLEGAWKNMYKEIEVSFLILKDSVKNRDGV